MTSLIRLIEADVVPNSFTTYQKASLEEIQDTGNRSVSHSNQITSKLTSLLEAFKSASFKDKKLVNLRESNIRLEEKLRFSGDIMEVVRESKTTAEAREQHLRTTTHDLLTELKNLRDQMSTKANTPPIKEHDMISTWHLKYSGQHSKFAEQEESLRSKEADINRQELLLQNLDGQVRDVEVERDAALQRLSSVEQISSAQQGALEGLKRGVSQHTLLHTVL